MCYIPRQIQCENVMCKHMSLSYTFLNIILAEREKVLPPTPRKVKPRKTLNNFLVFNFKVHGYNKNMQIVIKYQKDKVYKCTYMKNILKSFFIFFKKNYLVFMSLENMCFINLPRIQFYHIGIILKYYFSSYTKMMYFYVLHLFSINLRIQFDCSSFALTHNVLKTLIHCQITFYNFQIQLCKHLFILIVNFNYNNSNPLTLILYFSKKKYKLAFGVQIVLNYTLTFNLNIVAFLRINFKLMFNFMSAFYIEITVYPALGPSLSKIDIPLSRYSSRDNQNDSLSLVTSPNTAPPINTISLRSGGSSIRILSF
ncbi:hypothetical protein AGLY_015634 [Aphis glycines]|uniref:Uncharacterized protein n=1 Tax=Aphis glycines TaxID=307491 RepID=A0A6G0T256_APHGL|nr:hypothetical protein AGLY_015634 [Aphis glycines]